MTKPLSRDLRWKTPPADAKRAKVLEKALPDTARAEVAAILSGSPYLERLALKDVERLERLLDSDPDETLANLLVDTSWRSDESNLDLQLRLRRAKDELALLSALCDCGGAWNLGRVTHALSDFAEAALRASTAQALAAEAQRGRITLDDPDKPESNSGFFVLGMGKLGARELNYSSDVDLIAFYDRDRVKARSVEEQQATYVKVTQTIAKLMQEKMPAGYVFRVDLRLRPDPGSTPLAISTAMAANYYEAVGQNWERAAYIKARTVAGDDQAGQAFLGEIAPFMWRKYLDYAAIAEVHAMKREIHAAKGLGDIAIPGHNLKLGRGGIREIEFFAQTQQLIGGGRDKTLRSRETLATLDALVAAGWINDDTRDDLTAAYQVLRTLEHRVQMVEDAQTHDLPRDAKSLDSFARFAGFSSRAALETKLLETLNCVSSHYARLFERSEKTPQKDLRFGAKDDPATLDALKSLGFKLPGRVCDIVRGWQTGRYPAMRTQVARERLSEIVPLILEGLATTDAPLDALEAFDAFVSRLPSGVQLFSLLKSNPALIEFFATLLGSAPRLSAHLARAPRLLDGLIEDLHQGRAQNKSAVAKRLTQALSESVDLEDALDRARLFAQETHFTIGARLLSGRLAPHAAGPAYTDLAEAIIRELLPRVHEGLKARHGTTPNGRLAIVALGKFGSREMTATSDLDLMLLYDDDVLSMSKGEKPLYAQEYYIRLTQRLVAALSAQTSKGTIYQVDFRLRPSGNKGPIATSLKSFIDYQSGEAWTWEKLALVRARVIYASDGFEPQVEQAITNAIHHSLRREKMIADVIEMRGLMARERPPRDQWDLKLVDGGQVDIEFIAQTMVLMHLAEVPSLRCVGTNQVLLAASEAGLIEAGDASALIEAGNLYNGLTQLMRLCLEEPFDPAKAPKGFIKGLLSTAHEPDIKHLRARLDQTRAKVRSIFENLLGLLPRP